VAQLDDLIRGVDQTVFIVNDAVKAQASSQGVTADDLSHAYASSFGTAKVAGSISSLVKGASSLAQAMPGVIDRIVVSSFIGSKGAGAVDWLQASAVPALCRGQRCVVMHCGGS
jgi:hypothetical protein